MSAPARTSAAPVRRKNAADREAEIIAAAAQFFAAEGFGGTTRDLARKLGVTQALLYKYFPSKQALVDRVFTRLFAERWRSDPNRGAVLVDRSLPLVQRLTRYYQASAGRADPTRARLWMRANLDGLGFAGRYGGTLTERVLGPIVAELRHEARLPEFAVRPLMRGERELAMALHGCVVFLGIRRNIYRMPMPKNVDDLVALQVRAWLPGAIAEIRRLHGPAAESSLAVEMLRGR